MPMFLSLSGNSYRVIDAAAAAQLSVSKGDETPRQARGSTAYHPQSEGHVVARRRERRRRW